MASLTPSHSEKEIAADRPFARLEQHQKWREHCEFLIKILTASLSLLLIDCRQQNKAYKLQLAKKNIML